MASLRCLALTPQSRVAACTVLAVANFAGYVWVEPAFALSWGLVAPALALELLLLRLHYLHAARPKGEEYSEVRGAGGVLL